MGKLFSYNLCNKLKHVNPVYFIIVNSCQKKERKRKQKIGRQKLQILRLGGELTHLPI